MTTTWVRDTNKKGDDDDDNNKGTNENANIEK